MALELGFGSNLSTVLGQEVRSTIMLALGRLWEDNGQDVAEYAIMLAVVLAVVVGTIRLIGSNANSVFSSVGSSIQ
jgi:pilus assembly protein Flp/PilA